MLYQFTVPGHVYRKLRIKSWSVKSLGWKKGSRLRLCFRVVDDVPEKKGMDLWKQMSSSKCSFTCICGISLPLNPSTTTLYARSAFYPSLRFTPSLQSAFYTGVRQTQTADLQTCRSADLQTSRLADSKICRPTFFVTGLCSVYCWRIVKYVWGKQQR